MKLTLAESRLLKEPINIIYELVSEVNIKVDKNKVELIAMDPANVVMVIFKLLSSAFVEYEVKDEKVISLSLDNLNQVFRMIKPSDTLILELDEDKNRLKIKLRGNTHRTFNLSLLHLEDREHKVPELEFPLRIETNSVIFENAIEDASIVADSVGFIVDKNKFIVKSQGNISDANIELATDEETDISIDSDDKISAKYSVEYLKKIIKSGVFIVTTIINDVKNGWPISWCSKISFQPPLVMVSLGKNRKDHEKLMEAEVFAINVLGEKHLEVGRHFGLTNGENVNNFDGIDCIELETGSPILKDAAGSLDCKIVKTIDAGDHVIFIGEVLDVVNRDGDGLVFKTENFP